MMPISGFDDDDRNRGSRVGNPIIYNMPAAASYTGNQTYTVADVMGGIIVHDATGNVTGTFPSAAALVKAFQILGSIPAVGDVVYLLLTNGANAAGTITISLGTGGSFDANQGGGSRVVPFAQSKTLLIRLTNITPGSEGYIVYS